MNEVAWHPSDSKRFSDLLVRVKHDSKGASHGSWREVLLEGRSHETVVSMARPDLAPDALVVYSRLSILSFVDVRNALAVVPDGVLALGDACDLDEGLLLSLSPLSSFEADEGALCVKPAQNKSILSEMNKMLT